MTSRRPYLCSKQWIGGHVCVQNNESAAMFVYKTMNRRPCLCTKEVLWELNSFHMLKLSFIPSNLQSCWPRDWKRSTHLMSMNLFSIVFTMTFTIQLLHPIVCRIMHAHCCYFDTCTEMPLKTIICQKKGKLNNVDLWIEFTYHLLKLFSFPSLCSGRTALTLTFVQ